MEVESSSGSTDKARVHLVLNEARITEVSYLKTYIMICIFMQISFTKCLDTVIYIFVEVCRISCTFPGLIPLVFVLYSVGSRELTVAFPYQQIVFRKETEISYVPLNAELRVLVPQCTLHHPAL